MTPNKFAEAKENCIEHQDECGLTNDLANVLNKIQLFSDMVIKSF